MKHKRITKCVAAVLAAVLVSQCATVALGASAETQTYAGTVLAAVNTDYTESRFPKTFETESSVDAQSSDVQPDAERQKTKPQAWELLRDQLEPMTYEEAVREQAMEGGTVEAQRSRKPYRVGDTRSIPRYPELPDNYETMTIKEVFKWLADYARSTKLELTCVYTDDVCTVWIEDVNAWSEDDIRDMGSFVGGAIPRLEDLFGDVRIDTDKDGKFAVFIHSIPESDVVIDKQGGTTLGYFVQYDLMDNFGKIGDVRMKSQITDAALLSSHADCFHININCWDLETAKETFVHEYQHYIHSCYCYAGKNNKTYLKEDPLYINEGFSIASEFILHPSDWTRLGYLECFNKYQDGFSLVTWENHIANYGLAFPFFQYVRTRYAELIGDTESDYPGKGIYKRVLESRNKSNEDNTLGVIADILYPADRYPSLRDTDARCRQLITDFWLAVFYKEPKGEHGFNGEEWAYDLYVNCGSLEEDELAVRNGMARFYALHDGEQGQAKIVNAEEGLRFIAIDEPMRTVTLDMNDGTGDVQTLSGFRTFFTLPAQDVNPLHREGYVFAGWALTADAESPVYASGDKITVRDSLTLYAVWKAAEKIETDTSYPFDFADGESVTAQIVPSEDGVYYLESSLAYRAIVFNQDRSVEQSLLCEDDGVYLTAGVTYTLYITFYPSAFGENAEGGTYALKRRTEYYSLYYLYLNAETDPDAWDYCQQYGTVYTVLDADNVADGMDFCGWSTDPNAAEPMYEPGDQITLTADTVLYAVWKPWYALQAGKSYTVPTQTDRLRFVPEETAVYGFTFTTTDDKYMFNVYSEEQAINDQYSLRTVTRTYTMYAGQTYFIYTENVGSVLPELVSKELQHTLTLYVMNALDFSPIKTLSVELKGKNTYVLPADYKPVSLGYHGFDFWIDFVTADKYYPGETVSMDRDLVLIALGQKTYFDDSDGLTISKLTGTIIKMCVQYIPTWVHWFVLRLRCFGLSGFMTRKSIPWVALA